RTPCADRVSAVYSPRPHPGAILELSEWGGVARAVGIRHLEEVQGLQMERTLRRHRQRIGSVVEVLVEEPGFGRSRENWTVHCDGNAGAGDLVRVRVDSATLV